MFALFIISFLGVLWSAFSLIFGDGDPVKLVAFVVAYSSLIYASISMV